MSEWQPIETAPSDGTEFQAWIARRGSPGYWETRCKFNEDGTFVVWDRIDYDVDGWEPVSFPLAPTHWMPHPEPPQ